MKSGVSQTLKFSKNLSYLFISKIKEYYSYMIDIIPKEGYNVLESEVYFYVYDGKTGCREVGDFR